MAVHPSIKKARELVARLQNIEHRFAIERARRILGQVEARQHRDRAQKWAQSLVFKTHGNPTDAELKKRREIIARARKLLAKPTEPARSPPVVDESLRQRQRAAVARARELLRDHKGGRDLVDKTHASAPKPASPAADPSTPPDRAPPVTMDPVTQEPWDAWARAHVDVVRQETGELLNFLADFLGEMTGKLDVRIRKVETELATLRSGGDVIDFRQAQSAVPNRHVG